MSIIDHFVPTFETTVRNYEPRFATISQNESLSIESARTVGYLAHLSENTINPEIIVDHSLSEQNPDGWALGNAIKRVAGGTLPTRPGAEIVKRYRCAD